MQNVELEHQNDLAQAPSTAVAKKVLFFFSLYYSSFAPFTSCGGNATQGLSHDLLVWSLLGS